MPKVKAAVGIMKQYIVPMLALAIIIAGCVANPQGTASDQSAPPQPPQQAVAQQAQPNAGQLPGGSQPQNAPAANVTLTLAEIAKHNTANDCWMVVSGKVLDLSPFTSHPGGSAYVPFCGTDATDAYGTKGGKGSPHSSYAVSMMQSFELGTLGQQATVLSANQSNVSKPPLYNGEDENEGGEREDGESDDDNRQWDD